MAKQEEKQSENKVNAVCFCNIYLPNDRERFVMEKKFKNEEKTISEWKDICDSFQFEYLK